MKRVLGHDDSKLDGVLFNFAKEKPLGKINGRKKQKTGKEIPVQPRRRSTRKYKQSGKGRAIPGRRHDNINMSITGLIRHAGQMNMVDGENSGNSMEPPKKKKNKASS